MDLMHLNLPGFPKESRTDQSKNLGASRIETLTGKFAQPPKRPYVKYKFKSDQLDDRISWIEREINVGKRLPETRQIAGQVLRKVPPRQWKKSATALFGWTRKNVRYTLDPHNVELFQSTQRLFETGMGDCDDQVIMLASLLTSVGIPVRLRVIGLKGSDTFQHIYILAGLPPDSPSSWFPLDPSRAESAGWELPESERGLLQDYDVDDYDPED